MNGSIFLLGFLVYFCVGLGLVALVLALGDNFLLYGYVDGGDLLGALLVFQACVHSRVEGVAVVVAVVGSAVAVSNLAYSGAGAK